MRKKPNIELLLLEQKLAKIKYEEASKIKGTWANEYEEKIRKKKSFVFR